MKRLLLWLAAMAVLQGQAPTGSVDIAATITATAGTLVCVGTPSVASAASNMHMKCSDAQALLHESDYLVASPGSVVYSIGRGANTITWLLTKGGAVPDQWQVSANGVSKSGNF